MQTDIVRVHVASLKSCHGAFGPAIQAQTSLSVHPEISLLASVQTANQGLIVEGVGHELRDQNAYLDLGFYQKHRTQ